MVNTLIAIVTYEQATTIGTPKNLPPAFVYIIKKDSTCSVQKMVDVGVRHL